MYLNMHDESSPPAPLYSIVCLNKIPLSLRKKKIEIERSWLNEGKGYKFSIYHLPSYQPLKKQNKTK